MESSKLSKIVNSGFDIAEIEKLANYQFASESELIQSINELHNLYVHKRVDLEDNQLDSRLASAYLHLFFSTNVPKLFRLLNYLPTDLIKKISQSPWIDFGSGPATFTFSWYAWLKVHGHHLPPEAVLIEKDFNMRALAQNVLEEYFRDEQIIIRPDIAQTYLKDSVLFFGFSYNELKVEVAEELIRSVDPKFIIFLEPGTQSSFRQILAIRKYLALKNYKVHYPCPHQKTCPLTTVKENWCHQYIPLKFHPEIERLTQLAGLNRRDSAQVFHIYEKNSQPEIFDATTARVIRGPIQTKGSWSWQVCNNEGKIEEIETLMRHYTKDQKDNLERKIPGEKITFSKEKEIKPAYFRALITQL